MKKKVLLLALVLIVIASASSFAIGIGGAGTYGWGSDNGVSGGFLTLKLDELPLLGIDFSASTNYISLGATADWWMANENLAGMLNWYWGLGGYGRVTLADPVSFAIGARMPIGLNMFILDPLELFIEAAPSVGIGIGSSIGLDWGVQGALGFRFWF